MYLHAQTHKKIKESRQPLCLQGMELCHVSNLVLFDLTNNCQQDSNENRLWQIYLFYILLYRSIEFLIILCMYNAPHLLNYYRAGEKMALKKSLKNVKAILSFHV